MTYDPPIGETWTFLAGSPARQSVLELAKRAAPSRCPVLIIGPTGVGKEVLAENIHANSPRASRRFIAINCASLTMPLFESEMFGHQRGAYTGALARKAGMVELADSGTLFLDEVGELSLEMQAKLLRFLASGVYWPVGATEEQFADVRVIAATNRNLKELIPAAFREDLYYRLNVMPITVPPIQAEDTKLICHELAQQLARREDRPLQPGELSSLVHLAATRRWPGGVRELRNVLERYFLLRERERTIAATWELCCALSGVQAGANGSSFALPDVDGSAAEVLRRFDDLVFLNLARDSSGVRDLADRMGRTPQAVYERLKKLGVSPNALRGAKLSTLLTEARGALSPYRSWIQGLLDE